MRRAIDVGLLAALVLATAGPGCSGATGRIGGAGGDGGSAGGSSSGVGDGAPCVDPTADCAGKCGQWVDACDALVTCGGCGSGQTCGGGGAPNVCGAGLCFPSCEGQSCGASNGCDAPCSVGCKDGGTGSSSGGTSGSSGSGSGSTSGSGSSSGSSSGSGSGSGSSSGSPKDAGSADANHPDSSGLTCSPYATYGCLEGSAPRCCAGLGCDPYLDVCYVASGGSCAGAQSHCVGVENTTCLSTGVCGATTTCETAGADCSQAACCTNYPCTPFSNGSFVCETAGQCVPSGASCEIAPCCPGAGACTKTSAGAYCQ